ncbi:TonB-dependent siderophore receptor [Pseudoalteromonas aurantia]|uniref:TonB-dependent siderophore receptor n=1 Tax=Pseudoalteromonas aurantia TaxID=43654 RepID=A0ABY2VUU0_9GAMM|nr:TonB-dependent siderophore receptor [Pseudoalteromonas aurantia]TMO61375.1 TonB-dependent siderophore receptor [Pseudoalteromonas aurantia]TMO72233.1 TonB-dependent siderophore receptor [Pseudoalteromonas aurantia]
MTPLVYACRLSVLSLSLAAAFSSHAAQNSQDSDVEKIEVTGERQAYRGDFTHLQSPEAILELDADLIENTGLTGLTQVLDLSASVSRQNSLGGLWDSFAIRGFFGDENVPSGYLVNGFNAGRGFSGPRDASGIERVEILKGPKAALFGRGEPGGSINLVTKKPTFESSSELELTLGSRKHQRVEADVNTVIADNLAGRFIGFYQQEDSFRDTIETQKQGITASFLFDQSDRSTWTYELEYAEQEIPFDRGVIAPGGNFDFMPIERFLGEPGDGPTTTMVHGHQLQWLYDLNSVWQLSSAVAFRQTELDSLSSDADMSPSRQKLFYDGQTLTRQHRERAYDTDQYVARFEIAGDIEAGGFKHNIIAGVDYDRFEFDRDYRVARAPKLSTNPTDAQLYALNVHNPVYGLHTPPTPMPVIVRQQNQSATGLYIQDQIALTDSLQIRVGGRFDWLKQTTNDKVRNMTLEQSEQHFSPQLGLVYQFTDNFSLYSTYGEGYRLNFGADYQGNGFEPNQTESIELGTKWSLLDNALDITLAYFDSEQTNIIVADMQNLGFETAIGEASSRGIELDIAGQLPADAEIRFSYTYLDAQVEKDALDTGLYVGIKAGDDLLNIPEHSASLQLSQHYTVYGNDLSAGLGFQYVDERLGQRGSDFYLPSYVVFNMFAKYDVNKAWTVKAQVHNAFDRTHYTNSYTQMWVQPGEPRKVLLSAAYKF